MYNEPAPETTTKLLANARLWLLVGVAALALAGLFSLVLVIARTPSLSNIPLFARLFHEALVVHVNLSVLTWFLAIACMVMSMESAGKAAVLRIPYLERSAIISFALGSVVMALSPLDRSGEPMMSNYIPVISNAVFFLGLCLIFAGVMLQCAHCLLCVRSPKTAGQWAALTGAIITLAALGAFVMSAREMPESIVGQQYYEVLFWGGGHILQFTHGQMLMLAWIVLSAALMKQPGLQGKLLAAIFIIGLVAGVGSFAAYGLYPVEEQEFRLFFTRGMIALGGLAPLVLGVLLLAKGLAGIPLRREKRALFSSLVMSVLLFGYGGVLGLMIRGQDVTIPAHYHGSIVGVTLAFMGFAYVLLPYFGYRDVSRWRLAFWQPICYGGGQALHISGLAWSGGYGVLRKTPGALEGGFTAAKAAMGLMGGGGLIAVIGGIMFVVVVIRAVWPEEKEKQHGVQSH